MNIARTFLILFIAWCSILNEALAVPEDPDTLRYTMEEVVVTADRSENRVGNATASISVVTAADLKNIPAIKVADLFQFVPGFTVTSFDGVGRSASINARGFYGGGEAEYNVVLVDGMPVNDFENGLVNWSLIPLQDVHSIEVVRGGSSPLYGDAALGSVVNIMTRKDLASRSFLTLGAGSFNSFNVGASTSGSFSDFPFRISFTNELIKGYRSHSMWRGTSAGGMLGIPLSENSRLELTTQNQWVKSNDPGPLTEKAALLDPTSGSVFYRNDGKDERRNNAALHYSIRFSENSSIETRTSYRYRTGRKTRTFVNPLFLLDPGPPFVLVGIDPSINFGDTQERITTSHLGSGTFQYTIISQISTFANRFAAGVDAEYGTFNTSSISRFHGFESDYRQGVGGQGVLSAEGKDTRWKYAVFINDEISFTDRFSLNLGVRFDGIEDSDERATGVGSISLPKTSLKTSNTSVSPKIGMNFRIANTEQYSGSIYASVNRSFKAATVDQLFDQQRTYAASRLLAPANIGLIGPMIDPQANNELKPQHSTTFEIGLYQRFLLNGFVGSELTCVLYESDLKDEIDFDISTFRYQNVSASRHRGIESGLKINLRSDVSVFANYTWSQVTLRSGELAGNKLKGIPENVFTGGVVYSHPIGFTVSVTLNSYRNTFLDDENSARLSPYTIVGGKLAYRASPVQFFIDGENLTDRKFSSSGYILFGTTYLFPGAGRGIRGGVSVEW